MKFCLLHFASVFQAVFLYTAACLSKQVLWAVFLNTAACSQQAFVSASRFLTRAFDGELWCWPRPCRYIAYYIAYYIHTLSSCALRSSSEEQSTEVRLSSLDSVYTIHNSLSPSHSIAEFITNSITNSIARVISFVVLSLVLIQLQFICMVVPLCLNSVACRFIILSIQVHGWISRFPKALLHYSCAAVYPSLATRCLEEADNNHSKQDQFAALSFVRFISYGSHQCPCEVTGWDRYFTFQDTHSCSFSHSVASFSITCEMVALGPALHGLRYGATCYFQLVFQFALLLCCALWCSDCPTARRCTVKASVHSPTSQYETVKPSSCPAGRIPDRALVVRYCVKTAEQGVKFFMRMFCIMAFALCPRIVSADPMETSVMHSVVEQVQPLHVAVVAKPFLVFYAAIGLATIMMFMIVCHMYQGGAQPHQYGMIHDLSLLTADEVHMLHGRKGKGKGQPVPPFVWERRRHEGGKGKGLRQNPIDSDGNVMKCSECGSEEHFRNSCPRTRQVIAGITLSNVFIQELNVFINRAACFSDDKDRCVNCGVVVPEQEYICLCRYGKHPNNAGRTNTVAQSSRGELTTPKYPVSSVRAFFAPTTTVLPILQEQQMQQRFVEPRIYEQLMQDNAHNQFALCDLLTLKLGLIQSREANLGLSM